MHVSLRAGSDNLARFGKGVPNGTAQGGGSFRRIGSRFRIVDPQPTAREILQHNLGGRDCGLVSAIIFPNGQTIRFVESHCLAFFHRHFRGLLQPFVSFRHFLFGQFWIVMVFQRFVQVQTSNVTTSTIATGPLVKVLFKRLLIIPGRRFEVGVTIAGKLVHSKRLAHIVQPQNMPNRDTIRGLVVTRWKLQQPLFVPVFTETLNGHLFQICIRLLQVLFRLGILIETRRFQHLVQIGRTRQAHRHGMHAQGFPRMQGGKGNGRQMMTNGRGHLGGGFVQFTTLVKGTDLKDAHVQFQSALHASLVAVSIITSGHGRAGAVIRSKVVRVKIDVIKLVGINQAKDRFGRAVRGKSNVFNVTGGLLLSNEFVTAPFVRQDPIHVGFLAHHVKGKEVDVTEFFHMFPSGVEAGFEFLERLAGIDFGLKNEIFALNDALVHQTAQGVDKLQFARAVHSRRFKMIQAQVQAALDDLLQIPLRIARQHAVVRRTQQGNVFGQPRLLNPHPAARDNGHLDLGPTKAHLGNLKYGRRFVRARSPRGGVNQTAGQIDQFGSIDEQFLHVPIAPEFELSIEFEQRIVGDEFQIGANGIRHGRSEWVVVVVVVVIVVSVIVVVTVVIVVIGSVVVGRRRCHQEG
mmetsp:Transcript_22725/g.63199  ORF Transcript_22725/g.63199 Transcript_22725/m.63199 type:complete len:633 (-) Transcript_22725:195-2093(-)